MDAILSFCVLIAQALTIVGVWTIINLLNNMPTKADLDAALASLNSNLDALTTAIQNLPKPGDEDFTLEIQAVTDAAGKVAADIAAIAPPPQP
jgi:hypothetical protein